MGGWGSGRFRGTRRPLVEHQDFLSASMLAVEWRRSGMPGKVEICHPGGAPQAMRVEGTRQPRGEGMRLWLLCPLCERRRTTLYLDARFLFALRPRFACRECLGLRYRSQRLSTPSRWSHRAAKLLKRAGCSSEDSYYWRPKRMRWTRFIRLIDEAELLEDAAFGWRIRGMFKPESWVSRTLRSSSKRKARPID